MKYSFLFNFFLFILVVVGIAIPSLEAAALHAILVGDTKDKELKCVTRKDLRNMEAHIDEIFDSIHVDELSMTIYTGCHVHSDFLSDLKKLNVQSDDVVFFYFTGHGFYSGDTTEEDWPVLYLSQQDVGIPQTHIRDILFEHNPHLLICLADCCNNILEEDEEKPEMIMKEMVCRAKNLPKCSLNVNRLFEQQGIIMIASASPGCYAEGIDTKGSDFTNCYLKMFRNTVRSTHEQMSWDLILGKTQKMLWKQQKPHYQLIFK